MQDELWNNGEFAREPDDDVDAEADTGTLRERFVRQCDAAIAQVLNDVEVRESALEREPYRGRLFSQFAVAWEVGLDTSDAPTDLSADGIARRLATRWNMANMVGDSVHAPQRLTPTAQAKMRGLLSFLRMWTEWEYAWSRWSELHEAAGQPHDGGGAAPPHACDSAPESQ